MTLELSGPAPPGDRPGDDQTATTQPLNKAILSQAAFEPAWIAVVVTRFGVPRRRPYLSLHHAAQAVQRARGKGEEAWLVLCKLEPVQADLGGGWSS